MSWREPHTDEWRKWNTWSGGVSNEDEGSIDSGDDYAGESDEYAGTDDGYAGGDD